MVRLVKERVLKDRVFQAFNMLNTVQYMASTDYHTKKNDLGSDDMLWLFTCQILAPQNAYFHILNFS